MYENESVRRVKIDQRICKWSKKNQSRWRILVSQSVHLFHLNMDSPAVVKCDRTESLPVHLTMMVVVFFYGSESFLIILIQKKRPKKKKTATKLRLSPANTKGIYKIIGLLNVIIFYAKMQCRRTRRRKKKVENPLRLYNNKKMCIWTKKYEYKMDIYWVYWPSDMCCTYKQRTTLEKS